MRINTRAFPIPVVGNGDDVNAGFQATLDVEDDKIDFFLTVEIVCSSLSLRTLIDEGVASYIMHIDCPTTMFRKAIRLAGARDRVSISTQDIDKAVEVTFFIVANNDLTQYVIDAANVDFDGVLFSVASGDILAYSETHRFDASLPFDALRNISALINVVGSSDEGRRPAQVMLTGEKVVIRLSKDDFQNYMIMRNDAAHRELIVTALVLPALMEAVHTFWDKPEEERDMYRWCRVLSQKIDELGVETRSPFEISQLILKLPLQRAFRSMSVPNGEIAEV